MVKHCIRIVGGQYRRSIIAVPDAPGLRPTPDRVRETLFNWLAHLWGHDFAAKHVLDLFAGSGALGFEAASRGVAFVQMVETDRRAVAALRALRDKLKIPAHAMRIHAGDALTALTRAAARYDLVLLDPPFGQGWLARLWPALPGVLHEGGLVYVESEAPIGDVTGDVTSDLTIAPPPDFVCLRQDRASAVHYALLQYAPALTQYAPAPPPLEPA